MTINIVVGVWFVKHILLGARLTCLIAITMVGELGGLGLKPIYVYVWNKGPKHAKKV